MSAHVLPECIDGKHPQLQHMPRPFTAPCGVRRHTHTHTPLGEKLYPANAEAVSRSIQRYCGTRICVFCKPKINSR
ncbi:unnamed protein product [Arctogadus glacialis]